MKNAVMVSMLSLVLASSGCSAAVTKAVTVVGNDLDKAIARGEKVLGPDDELVACYKAINKIIKARLSAEDLDDGLLLDFAMKARIGQKVREEVQATLKKECAEIAVEVMVAAGSKGLVR